MINPQMDIELHRYMAFRDRLLKDDPAIDERTLADTLEGLTDFREALAETIRAALEDEKRAQALEARIHEMAERAEQFEHRATIRRAAVREAMESAGLKQLAEPDFSASLRANAPHVIVIDEKLIPKRFFEDRPHLLKRELGDAMKGGEQVPGAALSNPGLSLQVRTR